MDSRQQETRTKRPSSLSWHSPAKNKQSGVLGFPRPLETQRKCPSRPMSVVVEGSLLLSLTVLRGFLGSTRKALQGWSVDGLCCLGCLTWDGQIWWLGSQLCQHPCSPTVADSPCVNCLLTLLPLPHHIYWPCRFQKQLSRTLWRGALDKGRILT